MVRLADAVAADLDADVMLYNGEIWRPMDGQVIHACSTRQRRRNVLLILVTMGGDADAAYRIARCLAAKLREGDALRVGLL